jgi:oligopeptide/dipeptide ABC transporter ATP-binding protein
VIAFTVGMPFRCAQTEAWVIRSCPGRTSPARGGPAKPSTDFPLSLHFDVTIYDITGTKSGPADASKKLLKLFHAVHEQDPKVCLFEGQWTMWTSNPPNSRDAVAPTPLLKVRNLEVCIRGYGAHRIRILEHVSFDVGRDETVCLVGESGAGKTTLAMAILRLLPASSTVVEGTIEFEGVPLLTLREQEMRRIRGPKISLVYQDSSILNPVLRVGDQIVEVLQAHLDWGRQRCKHRVFSLLEELEIENAERVYAAFPHQLSGGQRQRIALAQALACEPALVIADEPTASLDPDTTSEIVGLLGQLKRRFHTSFLWITHDYSILTEASDRIMIMYAGRIVEQGSRSEVLQEPMHPYTRALFKCGMRTPSDGRVGKSRMPTIPGRPPDPSSATPGCDFENRCHDRMSICCTRVPEEVRISSVHEVRCFKFGP